MKPKPKKVQLTPFAGTVHVISLLLHLFDYSESQSALQGPGHEPRRGLDIFFLKEKVALHMVATKGEERNVTAFLHCPASPWALVLHRTLQGMRFPNRGVASGWRWGHGSRGMLTRVGGGMGARD